MNTEKYIVAYLIDDDKPDYKVFFEETSEENKANAHAFYNECLIRTNATSVTIALIIHSTDY